MGEWISVDKALPEPGSVVLLIAKRDFGTSCHYLGFRTEPMLEDGTMWTWRDSHQGYQLGWFTHWQPLPAAPREGGLDG